MTLEDKVHIVYEVDNWSLAQWKSPQGTEYYFYFLYHKDCASPRSRTEEFYEHVVPSEGACLDCGVLPPEKILTMLRLFS